MNDLQRAALNLLTQRTGYVVAAITFAFVGVGVLSATRFDVSTAYVLLAAGDPAHILFATVVSYIPTFLTFSAGVVWAHVVLHSGDRWWFAGIATALSYVSFRAASPGVWLVVAIAVLINIVWWSRARSRPGATFPVNRTTAWIIASVFGPMYVVLWLVLAVLVPQEPWLPSERLGFSDGSTRVGYVVSIADGWLEYLSEDTREVVIVRADSLLTRISCRTVTVYELPLRMGAEAQLPPCS